MKSFVDKTWRSLRASPTGFIGAMLVSGFLLLALVGPFFSSDAATRMDLFHEYAPPSDAHWFGTAENGVDLGALMIRGARTSAIVALLVVALSLIVGGSLGVLAGMRRGTVDHVITGTADVVQAFPSIILNIVFLALVSRPSIVHVVLAMFASGWVMYARLARALTLSLREREYVQAAHALGYSPARVAIRHVIPNLAGPLIVQATSGIGGVILAEATLAFLGLGSGEVSWGALLDQGTGVLLRFPHVAIASGLAIALTVLGFNLSGDWLRDQLDVATSGA